MKHLNSFTYNQALEILQEAVKIGANFKVSNEFKAKSWDKQYRDEIFAFPSEGIEINKLFKIFDESVLPFCSNFNSKKFMGFPDSGNSIAALSGMILSGFSQQNLINESFCSPIATHMEIAVINWLRSILGYEINKIDNIFDVGGIFTNGGTGSNATAMLIARENHVSSTMKKGVMNPENFKVVVAEGVSHYSIRSSLMWLGIGDNILSVDSTNYKFDLNALKETLIKNKGKIMSVIVNVGDSRTMTIEDLKSVYDIVKSVDENIWLHADACHGFSLAFSDELKHKLSHINLYDSISVDPHKVLMIPYTLSALLIKDPIKMKLIMSSSDLIMDEDFAFGKITPFIGSKDWSSLKLWFMMKNYGIKEIGSIIYQRYKTANILKDLIIDSSEFALINSVDFNAVVFMYIKDKKNYDFENIEVYNQISIEAYNRIKDAGDYYLHQFPLRDQNSVVSNKSIIYTFRYMSGNIDVTYDDLKQMLKVVKEACEGVRQYL